MLVYHKSKGRQCRALQEVIEASVGTDAHRQEVRDMGRTYAQQLQATGVRKGRKAGALLKSREILLRQLRSRFGTVPEETVAAVKACKDAAQLDTWLDNFATAHSLQDIGIHGPT